MEESLRKEERVEENEPWNSHKLFGLVQSDVNIDNDLK